MNVAPADRELPRPAQPLLLDEEGRGGEWVPDLKSNDVVSVYEPSTLPPGIHSAAVVHVSVAMPFPLAGRAFLSVVFTATPAEGEFWNVSVPVQDSSCPVRPSARCFASLLLAITRMG